VVTAKRPPPSSKMLRIRRFDMSYLPSLSAMTGITKRILVPRMTGIKMFFDPEARLLMIYGSNKITRWIGLLFVGAMAPD
jgi:hypothetical protein